MAELVFERIGTSIDDYNRAKKILDKARHPDFIGPQRFVRAAEKGMIIVASADGHDLGVLFSEGETLTVLSVARSAQGQGVGQALVQHANLKYVRAIQDRVAWFCKLGYEPQGPPDMSHKKFVVQMLVRTDSASAATTDTHTHTQVRVEPPKVETKVEFPPSAVSLVRQRVRSGEAPTVLELVEMALELYDLALCASFERDGVSWVHPEIGSAAKALELAARLCGYLGDGRQMTRTQLEQELDRMGYRLVPKEKLKAAG